MKIVTLSQPTTVYTKSGHGELRHPIEGPLTVSDEEAERLWDNNLLEEDPADFPQPGEDDGDDKPENLTKLTVSALQALAAEEGVPLEGVTKKADIISAIELHREEQADA